MRVRPKNIQAGRIEDWSTNDFLDALMKRYGVVTDYGLHKLLKVSRQSIYRYRDKAGATFDDQVALRVAELLDIDPVQMLVWTARQRASCTQAIEHWKHLQKRLAQAAMILIFLGLAPAPSIDLATVAKAAPSAQIYTLCAVGFAFGLLVRALRRRRG